MIQVWVYVVFVCVSVCVCWRSSMYSSLPCLQSPLSIASLDFARQLALRDKHDSPSANALKSPSPPVAKHTVSCWTLIKVRHLCYQSGCRGGLGGEVDVGVEGARSTEGQGEERADHLLRFEAIHIKINMLTEREPSCSVNEVCLHRLLHIREKHMKRSIKQHFKDS